MKDFHWQSSALPQNSLAHLIFVFDTRLCTPLNGCSTLGKVASSRCYGPQSAREALSSPMG